MSLYKKTLLREIGGQLWVCGFIGSVSGVTDIKPYENPPAKIYDGFEEKPEDVTEIVLDNHDHIFHATVQFGELTCSVIVIL